MPNNDYWAYLRDENELKHYRTPGTPNKNHKYLDIDANGNYIYDDKVAAAQARGQARAQQTSRSAKNRLIERGDNGGAARSAGGQSSARRTNLSVYNNNSRQTDGGDYGKNVAIPGVKYTSNTPYGSASIKNYRNKDGRYDEAANTRDTETFLEKIIQDVNNHASNSTDPKIAAAQARGQARQQEASRDAKRRLQLIDERQGGRSTDPYRSGSGNSNDSYGRTRDLVTEAQARGQARQQQARQQEESRAAKNNLRNQDEKQGGNNQKPFDLKAAREEKEREFQEAYKKYGEVGLKLRYAANRAKNKADEIGSKIKSAVSGAAAKAKEGITGTAAEIKRGITGTVDKAKKLKKKYFGGN